MSCVYDFPEMAFTHLPGYTGMSGQRSATPYGPANHMTDITRKMNEFRSNTHLCDITLRVDEGYEIPAHRVVLAAASPYFNTLFSSGFADSSQMMHELPWLSAKIAQNVVSFMYTGRITLCADTVSQALAAAEYFMLPQLKQHCVYFMKSSLNMKNVCQMLYLAELYQLKDLIVQVNETLDKFCSGEIFEDYQLLELPLEFIRGLIFDPRLKHLREADIADFVVRWVEHDTENRISSLDQLFGNVLLDCLPLWLIKKMAQKTLLKNSESCSKLLENAQGMYYSGIKSDMEDIVLVVAAAANPSCVGYIPRQDQWVKFKPLPRDLDLKRRNMKNLCIGSMMYLMVTVEESMAWLPPGVNGNIHATQFWCLDMEANSWTQLPPPISTSKCFHLINVGPHICALGIAGTLERYDIEEEVWLPCSSAPRTIAYFDTLQFTDDESLFVLSIYSSSHPQGCGHLLLTYDPLNDSWTSSILSNKDNNLVVITYHLPGRRTSCQRDDNGCLKLFNAFGIQWADIDFTNNIVKCWQWKNILPTKIYSNHGWTLPITDLSAVFILNSSTTHCAMFDQDTGYSKLTANCPTEIYLGQKTGCVAKISVSARQKLADAR